MTTWGDVPPNQRGRGERQLTSGPSIGSIAASPEVMARPGHLYLDLGGWSD